MSVAMLYPFKLGQRDFKTCVRIYRLKIKVCVVVNAQYE